MSLARWDREQTNSQWLAARALAFLCAMPGDALVISHRTFDRQDDTIPRRLLSRSYEYVQLAIPVAYLVLIARR